MVEASMTADSQSTMTITVKNAASLTARFALYPSLLYNMARNRLQDNWHWWDRITEHVILGALPFASMLETFREKGVRAVVTLNEDFEVFISSDQYKEGGFQHLHIPTVDYLYAPPLEDLHRGVAFIAEHAQRDEQVYVHCKAGRGRSTTLVLCYLVAQMHMSPADAYAFVRGKRPQVCLAEGQWAAVREFHESCLRARAESGETEPATFDRLAEADDGEPDLDEHAAAQGGALTAAAGPTAPGPDAGEPDLASSIPTSNGHPEAAAAAEGCGGGGHDSPAAARQQHCSAAGEPECATRCSCAAGSCACAELRQGDAPAVDERVEGPAAAPRVRICAPDTASVGVAATQETAMPEPGPADRSSLTAQADASGSARFCREPGFAENNPPPAPAPEALPVASQQGDALQLSSAEEAAAPARAPGVSAFQVSAAQPAAEDAVSLVSRRSLSRASMSMVLCDDFAMSFCREDEEEEDAERGPERPSRPAAAKKLRGSDGAASSAALASQFSMFSNELGDEEGPERMDSGLQRMQEWAAITREGSLESL